MMPRHFKHNGRWWFAKKDGVYWYAHDDLGGCVGPFSTADQAREWVTSIRP